MSRKGENIYKRKDNRWEARYIKGYHPDGSAKFGYCYGKSYREAKRKLTEAKASLISGKPVSTATKKRRIAFYCDEWLRLNRDRVKQSTYVKYSGMVEKHIKPRLGGYLVQSLSSLLIEEFSHDLLFEEALSPKTVKDILTILHSIIKYTSKQSPERLPEIDIIYPKVPKNEIRILSKEEQTRFVNYLLDDMDECKFGVLLALLTGMRIGEVCALRWSNISLTEKTIQVNATMQRLKNLDEGSLTKTKIVISDPKSDFSTRITPSTHRVIRIDEENQLFYTKGDANKTEDGAPVHFKNLIGTPIFKIPLLGYIAYYIQHPPGMYIAIAAGAILLILVFLPDLFQKDEKKNKKSPSIGNTTQG